MYDCEQTSSPPVGFVGKLAAHADFVRGHVASRIGGELDRWLVKTTQQLLSAKGELPRAAVRYVFSAAHCDAVAIGVLVASRDHVGREFPLTLYTVLRAEVAARHMAALPLAYVEFLDDAEAIASAAVTASAGDLRAQVAELVPPDTDHVLAAAEECREALAQTPAKEMLQRVFAKAPPGTPIYALHTCLVAAAGAHSAAAQATPTLLDCPIEMDLDLAAWLELARRGLGSDATCPTFAWVQVFPRLLLALGHAPEQLLQCIADPSFKSSRLWPLITDRPEAIARARQVLGPRLGFEEGALGMKLDSLWSLLAPGRAQP